ncbi:MAG TPA: hypothetical protein VGB74_12575, partial [Actinoplanes sp.]
IGMTPTLTLSFPPAVGPSDPAVVPQAPAVAISVAKANPVKSRRISSPPVKVHDVNIFPGRTYGFAARRVNDPGGLSLKP